MSINFKEMPVTNLLAVVKEVGLSLTGNAIILYQQV